MAFEEYDFDEQTRGPRPRSGGAMTASTDRRRGTVELTMGDVVVTSQPDGEDFGLPLVSPTTREVRNRTVREVRSVVRAGGGCVVRFTDGTKTRPVHGRTVWVLADPPSGR